MEQRAGAQKGQAEPGRKEKPAAPAQGRAAPELPLLELQHAAGNRAVGRLLRSGMAGPAEPPRSGRDEPETVDAPLRRLGAPAPQGPVQNKHVDAGPPPQKILAQLRSGPGASAADAHAADAQAARHALSRGAGQPLDPAARGFFEQSFGFDFSPVRVHHDSQAAESAQSLHALAYTYGHNIVFRNGHYSPDTREGRRLLGHELAHVVQQSGGEGRVQGAGLGRDAYETEADLAAARALAGRPVGPLTPVGSSLVQKDEPTALVQAKIPQPNVKTPPPGGAYLLGKVDGAYVYVLNSEDALKSKDVWGVVVNHHLLKTFPGISPKVAKRVMKEVSNRSLTGGWRETAEKYTAVGFTITAELHTTLVTLVKRRDKDAVPVEPAPGDFKVGDDGEPGGSGPGGGTSTDPAPDVEGGKEGGAQEGKKPPVKNPETVNGIRVYLPHDISPEEMERILELLKEFLAEPSKKDDKAPKDFRVSDRLRKLLAEIAESPKRDEIIALVKPGDGSPLDRSLEDALETAIAAVKLEEARKDFNLPTGDGKRKNVPERRRPVRGDIVNLSKELVPNKLARFMVEFKNEVDAFRVPVAHIHWVAHKAGKRGEVVGQDFTGYIALPPKGSIDHRVFDVTFTEPGVYTIVAAVEHNFFEPNVFEMTVEVITEGELTRQLNEEALKGFAQPAQSAPHIYLVGGLTGYTAGTITRGDLDPKAVILSIEARLQTATDQKKQLEDLIEAYKKIETSDARQVVSWAEDYLETLKNSSGTLESAQKEGATALGVRGVFSSRTPEAPSKALNLLCYFIRKKGDDNYHLYLHDFTQLTEPTEYRFSASEKTVEKAQEEVFIDQADAYPAGRLSVTFQGYDAAARKPGTHYVNFEKVTDTVGKKIKAAVFDPYVDIAVNLATAVMMVVPGLQGLSIAIAIAYNTARTVSEMEEQANKGTLTAGSVTLGAVQIGLNLIPLAGKGGKLVTIAGRTFHTVEAITVGGNVLLVGTQAMSQIETLRNGIVKELAELEGQINAIEKLNRADPKLRDMKKRRDQLIEQGQTEARKIFASTVVQQGLMMVGQHLITGYMARKFSLGQLKSQGVFRHEKDVKAYYDFKERMIVGDELRITPPELERLQLRHGQSSALEGHVPDPVQRQQVVEALGDRPVEVQAGAKTGLREEGGRVVLEVAEGATPADIVAAAKGTTPPSPTPDTGAAAPGAQQQPAPPPAPDKPPAPAPAADKAADTPAATGQAEQAKQVVEKAAEAEARPATPEPPAPEATPAKDATKTAEKAADTAEKAPDTAEKAPDTAEKAPDTAEARPAPEDDFKPVAPEEAAPPGEKPKADTPEGTPAGDKSAEAEAKAKAADGAEATPAEAKPAETKPAPDAEAKAAAAAAEAQADAAAQASAKIDADARALFRELKKKGYQRGMRVKDRYSEDEFAARHVKEFYDPADSHWHPRDPSKVRVPPAPVPAGTTTAQILETLKGPGSKSTFKKFYETITGKGVATDAEVVAATDKVRRDLDLDNKPSNIDDVRHAIKEEFKDKMLDSMFEKPDGSALTPAESHAKMRELTTGLDSADKGPMTEEWQQRARKATTAREATAARDAAAAAETAAGKDAATSPEVAAARQAAAAKEAEAAAAASASEQVVVKQTGAMKGNRQLDRVEGETINEVKSGEGYLKEHDHGELDDHLVLANAGATIDIRGTKQKVTKVRWTFTSPEGASKNLDTLIERMEANQTTFSVEVYNSAGVPKTFTWADVSGANAGKLHEYLGKPYDKK